jgi:hypothetical protein
VKLHISVEIRNGRSGVEARSPELKLTSHGLDEQEAMASLQKGIIAWIEGLQSLDKLEQVIKSKQLKWESDGPSIIVEMEKATI